MSAEETSSERSGGGAQPDSRSTVDDSMPERKRQAQALGADARALSEAYSP